MPNIFPNAVKLVEGISAERQKLICTDHDVEGLCASFVADVLAHSLYKKPLHEKHYDNEARLKKLAVRQAGYYQHQNEDRLLSDFGVKGAGKVAYTWSDGDEDEDGKPLVTSSGIDLGPGVHLYVQCDFEREDRRLGHAFCIIADNDAVTLADSGLGILKMAGAQPGVVIQTFVEALAGAMGKCTEWRAFPCAPTSAKGRYLSSDPYDSDMEPPQKHYSGNDSDSDED